MIMNRALHLKDLFNESISRTIAYIILTFVLTCVFIVSGFLWVENKSQDYDAKIENQRIYSRLGRVIIRSLITLEKDIYQLSIIRDRRDIDLNRNRLQFSIDTIKSVLHVLKKGGTFVDVMQANFDQFDTIVGESTFVRKSTEFFDINVINLVPKIEDIENYVNRLKKLVWKRVLENQPDRNEEKKALNQLTTVLNRSKEFANKIFYDSQHEIHTLEEQKRQSMRKFRLILNLTIIAALVLTTFFAVYLLSKVIQQIKQQKQAEIQLQESEHRLKILQNSLASGFMLVDAETRRIVDINPAALEMIGKTREEVVGSNCFDLVCQAEDRKCPIIDLKQTVNSAERELNKADGSSISVLKTVSTLYINGKQHLLESFIDISKQKIAEEKLRDHYSRLEQLVAERTAELKKSNDELIEEITMRKKTEAALRESREQYRLIAENTLDLVSMCDTNMNATYVSPSHETVLGYKPEELMGKPIYTLVHPDDIREVLPGRRQIDIKSKNTMVTYRLRNKKGQYLWFETNANIIFNDDGEPFYGLFSTRNVTRQKENENELNRLQNLYANTIDLMPSAIIGIEKSGQVFQWNQEAELLFGIAFDKVKDRLIEEIIPGSIDLKEPVSEAMRQKASVKKEKIKVELQALPKYLDITVYPVITEYNEVAIVRIDDITQRIQMEEMMIQSEKMMSVGGLAAGMAHEINNPLAGILQNVQVLQNRTSKGIKKNDEVAKECGVRIEAIEDYMDKRGLNHIIDLIIESGKRAATIVNNMLSFAKKGGAVFGRHDLSELLDNTVDLAANEYDLKKRFDFRQIRIIREYEPDLPQIPCESSKIQQVFLNILKNSAQAMAEDNDSEKTPTITLRIRNLQKRVRVEIEDNGPGIPETVIKRVFEPFFTTKGADTGTGLGLSVSYFIIVENHSGKMDVESTLGEGTKFLIELPV